ESLESPPARPSRAPPMGFLPSSRRQLAESTHAGVPGPLRSVLGVSHALDGFLLRLPCGFISPRCHVQGSLSRVFPSREAVRARRPPLPSCRSHRPPALSLTQRRQGTVPASRALLRSRIRGGKWWVRPPAARYPPELSASLGFFFALRGNDLRRPLRPRPFPAPVVLPARDLTCSCEPASPYKVPGLTLGADLCRHWFRGRFHQAIRFDRRTVGG